MYLILSYVFLETLFVHGYMKIIQKKTEVP